MPLYNLSVVTEILTVHFPDSNSNSGFPFPKSALAAKPRTISFFSGFPRCALHLFPLHKLNGMQSSLESNFVFELQHLLSFCRHPGLAVVFPAHKADQHYIRRPGDPQTGKRRSEKQSVARKRISTKAWHLHQRFCHGEGHTAAYSEGGAGPKDYGG